MIVTNSMRGETAMDTLKAPDAILYREEELTVDREHVLIHDR